MMSDATQQEVRQFLLAHFTNVQDEQPQGDYWVFTMQTASGKARAVKVHCELLRFEGAVLSYLERHGVARQLQGGNAEIARPLDG